MLLLLMRINVRINSRVQPCEQRLSCLIRCLRG